MPFATIEEAINEIQEGRMVIIVDDEDRENEGDLMIAAEKVTPDAINFMATFGRGLICLPMTGQRLDELHIPLMVSDHSNTSSYGTAFCVTIEARRNVSTGISAFDRAQTVLTAIDPKTRPSDLARPGHIFPLRARDGGVLIRAGQTEAAVDLAAAAGLTPAGVICEIMKEDGTMARVPDLAEFAAHHQLKIITVADLIRYRLRTERFIQKFGETTLPTRYGDFRMFVFESMLDQQTHIALVRGSIENGENVLVRVQTHCLTGHVFGSPACRRVASSSGGLPARLQRSVQPRYRHDRCARARLGRGAKPEWFHRTDGRQFRPPKSGRNVLAARIQSRGLHEAAA